MLIVGLAIMGFTTVGPAFEETEEPWVQEYMKEEIPFESVEEEEYVA